MSRDETAGPFSDPAKHSMMGRAGRVVEDEPADACAGATQAAPAWLLRTAGSGDHPVALFRSAAMRKNLAAVLLVASGAIGLSLRLSGGTPHHGAHLPAIALMTFAIAAVIDLRS